MTAPGPSKGVSPAWQPNPTPRQTQVTTWFKRCSIRHLKVQHDQLNPRPKLAIVIRSVL
ncbi:hypothetical protein PIB30_081279, partial [Stylosanthes scabra]|nr:hypothetical protein [Stylosanthes scabra]